MVPALYATEYSSNNPSVFPTINPRLLPTIYPTYNPSFSPTIEKAGSADDAKTTECNLDKSNTNDPMAQQMHRLLLE